MLFKYFSHWSIPVLQTESLSIRGHLKSKLITWKVPWRDHENKPMFTQPRGPETSFLSEKFLSNAKHEDKTNSALRGFSVALQYIFTTAIKHVEEQQTEVRSVCSYIYTIIYTYSLHIDINHTHLCSYSWTKKAGAVATIYLPSSVPALPPGFHPASFVP